MDHRFNSGVDQIPFGFALDCRLLSDGDKYKHNITGFHYICLLLQY